MELFWKHDKWNYKITVKGKDNHGHIVTKVYRTIDIIADLSSNLRGRATRVYEAYEVGNPDSKVVIKDSWVDVSRTKEGDTLSEILDGASDDEKSMFLTVLVHGVVEIGGREDTTQDLLMNGYLISTDSPESNNTRENSGNIVISALERMLAELGIADLGSAGDTTQGDNIYTASIFQILRKPKPGSHLESLITSPDVSTFNTTIDPPRVYGPKAHYRIVFKERGESLHSLSCTRQIKLHLVVQAMQDILKGSTMLSDSTIESF